MEHEHRRRLPWPLIASAVLGLVFSGVFIGLSFRNAIGESEGRNVTGSDSSVVVTVVPIDGNSITFITGESADPGTGSQAAVGNVQIGQHAPDFTLNTLDGEAVTLSELRGRPVFINFWATWCGPCRIEMPAIERAYQEHAGEGLTVLAVNLTDVDDVASVSTFVDELNLTFPILLDVDGYVSGELYRVPGLPMSVFITPDGITERIQIGPMTGEQINEFVGEILA